MNTKAFLTVFAILFLFAACAPQQMAPAQPAAQPAQVAEQPPAAAPEAPPAVVPEEAPVAAPAPSPTASPPPGQTVDIGMKSFAFTQPSVILRVGDSVRWTNQDSAPHTATADDGSFDTGTLQQGASASHTFDKPGVYTYHCAIHPNMKAKIVVK